MISVEFFVVDGPNVGARHTFRSREVLVGRDFSNDLILNHEEVSPRHLTVVVGKEEVFLETSEGSKNTKLNGLPVSHEPLHNGDELQVGPYVFHISLLRDETPEPEDSLEAMKEAGRRSRAGRRPPLFMVLAVLVIAAVYAFVRLWGPEREKEDLVSAGPLRLPAEGVFGYQVGGANTSDKVEFSFLAQGHKHRLSYRPGFIGEAGLVEVSVNGHKLATAPVTVDRWADELVSIEIPQEMLKKEAENILCFDNVKSPPEKVRWGVRDVSVQEVAVPRCDVGVAMKYLRLAEEKYQERKINDRNLYDAILHLQQGEEYVISCEDPGVRNLVVETKTRYEEELTQMFEDYWFNARKFLKIKDTDSARYELEQALRKIPAEDDPRHRRAKDLLEKIPKKK